jgi:murein tripeptide amidase MpaA
VVPEITALLDEFEVHTIPIANPDGYEFSHTTNNNWRKSRKPNAGRT